LGISRRLFIKAGGMATSFAAARFSGLPVWAQTARSQPCFLHTGSTFAPFAQHFVDLLEPGRDEYVTEKYAFQLEAVLGIRSCGQHD
jgi:hypothetical protein